MKCGLIVSEGGNVVAPFLTDNQMSILCVGVERIGDQSDVLQGHLGRTQERSGAAHFMAFALGFGRH